MSGVPPIPRGLSQLVSSDLAEDPKIKAYASQLQKANYKTLGITVANVDAAMNLFRVAATESVAMPFEIQLYIDHFLEARKICHVWYKIFRSENAELQRLCDSQHLARQGRSP